MLAAQAGNAGKKKKVAFIEPTGAHSNIFAKYMKIPLLGPVYLATIAQDAGYDVAVLNENILEREVSKDELESIDVLCLSCITATVDRGREIAREYKKIRKEKSEREHRDLESRTLIGGIHASMIPEDVVGDFDHVVRFEAENIILDLLAGRIKDKIVEAERPENLDELPIPDFSLIKGWENISTFPVMTSRGCTYDCDFCSVTSMFGREYRAQSPERVMHEIMRFGHGDIFFSDDNFTLNQKRTGKILNLMIAYKFRRRWGAQVSTEVSKHPDLIAKMKKAGCSTVYVGFESINPSSLQHLNKKQTVEDIERTINIFHKCGIQVHGMFIFGAESDTKDTFRRTLEFCRRKRLEYVQYGILAPIPGSRTYSHLKSEGRIFNKDWSNYDGMHAVFNPANMTAYELQQGMIECFRGFYNRVNALRTAARTSYNTTMTPLRKLYRDAHFPSFYPAIMRWAGSRIVKEWLEHNKGYLEYLKYLPSAQRQKI